jgi:hypothetical protein
MVAPDVSDMVKRLLRLQRWTVSSVVQLARILPEIIANFGCSENT